MNASRVTRADSSSFRALLQLLAAVPVAALLALCAPGLAYATFSAHTGGALAVGTYTVPAPATASGNRTCNTSPRGITVTITSFAPVARATSYVATVTAPDGTISAGQTVSPSGFSVTKSSSTAGTYTLLIKAKVGSWTGTAFQKTYVC